MIFTNWIEINYLKSILVTWCKNLESRIKWTDALLLSLTLQLEKANFNEINANFLLISTLTELELDNSEHLSLSI